MLRKTLAAVMLVVGALGAAPLAASATGYQLDGVGDTTPTPGQSMTIVFNGFKPGSEVTVTLYSDPVLLGTFVSAPGEFGQGVVEATITIPSNTPAGAHSIVATGIDLNGQPKSVTLSITVLSTGSGLATTGTSILLLVSIGGLTMLLGWALLGSIRRHSAVA